MNKIRIAELAKQASEETNMMMIMEFKNFESTLWEKFAELVLKEPKPKPKPKWQPGDLPSENELLVEEIHRLRIQLRQLRDRNVISSWDKYPDRSGGAFSQDEIDNARAWR